MIHEFQDDWRWLSNFWPCAVEHRGMMFLHAEGAYQAAKTTDLNMRRDIALLAPVRAKYYAKTLTLPLGWELLRREVMLEVVRDKFTRNLSLRAALVATGDNELQEGNRWGDRFWGISPPRSGNGQNHLGRIIMQVRGELS